MRTLLSLFLTALCLQAEAKKIKPMPDHFLLTGKIVEMDLVAGGDKECGNVQIVVYQGDEIFVAFYSEVNGAYEFNLPLGHSYEIWFGGSTYVNKKVYINARDLPPNKFGYEVELDMGLFRPVENVDFAPLHEPFVKIAYDEAFEALAVDMDYTILRSKELDKVIKKAKKSGLIK
jgi:hypothetical protein